MKEPRERADFQASFGETPLTSPGSSSLEPAFDEVREHLVMLRKVLPLGPVRRVLHKVVLGAGDKAGEVFAHLGRITGVELRPEDQGARLQARAVLLSS